MNKQQNIDILAYDYETQLSLLILHFKLRNQFMEHLINFGKCTKNEAHKEWLNHYNKQQDVCNTSRDELNRAFNR